MIQLKNISFGYNSHLVLNDLNFSMEQGERVGLVGHTGSGKTTICLITMGLIAPNAGEIILFGRPRRKEQDFVDIRGRIGFLFQDADDQLFCPTVIEDVAFGPLNQGKSIKEAKEIVSGTLDSLGLKGFEERLTHQLSGGEKRLVSLATVLAMKPEVLILDEPTTGLDEETVDRLVSILNKSTVSYLIISHDRPFLERTADRFALLRNGAIE
jgi:cobalt/nickel transport system ATP-binding protein